MPRACASSSTGRARRPPASPMSISAGSEFEQPADLVLFSALSRSTTFSFCFSRVSASPTTLYTARASSGATSAYQTIASSSSSSTIARASIRSWASVAHRHDYRRFHRRQFRSLAVLSSSAASISSPIMTFVLPIFFHLYLPSCTPQLGLFWKLAVASSLLSHHRLISLHGSSFSHPAVTISSLPYLQGRLRSAAAAHDLRLSRQRLSHVGTTSPTTSSRSLLAYFLQIVGRGSAQGHYNIVALSEHAQHRRRYHGHRSLRPAS